MPNPSDYDSEKEWMAACVPKRIAEGNKQEQAVAACLNMWREKDKKSLFERAIGMLKSLVGINGDSDDYEEPAATGPDESKEELFVGGFASAPFTVWKAGDVWRWLAIYTNRYRDRDNPAEILTEASHRDFEKATDSGDWPMPELWPWHVPFRIGVADSVAYDDRGFMLATGSFDDPEVGERMSKQEGLGTSHGMPSKEIRRDEDDPTLIVRYRTREISPLRMKYAANPYTGFMSMEGKSMAVTDEKKQFLQEVLGDHFSKLESLLDGKAKEVEGVEYKDTVANDPAPEPEPIAVPVEEKKEEIPQVAPITREEIADAIAGVTNQFVEQFGKLVDEIAGLKSAMKDLKDAEEQREKEAAVLTPAASLHSMVQSRVIGSREARVSEDSKLAKSHPVTAASAGADGPTPVPLINAMMARR